MSRIGKQPIALPQGVTITVDDEAITVKGPKGELSQFTMDGVTVSHEDGTVTVTRANDERGPKAKHGLMRTLVNNMVVGVTQGFEKKLEINGVGFRASMSGTTLKMSLGFSHEIVYAMPDGIQAKVEGNVITVSGISKQLVGQVAAEIRSFKKPEPYKGKGIKYSDERVLRKSGKSGKE